MPKCFVCAHGELIRKDEMEVCNHCGYMRKARRHNTAYQSIRLGSEPVRAEQVLRLAKLMGWGTKPMELHKLRHNSLSAGRLKELCDRLEGLAAPAERPGRDVGAKTAP